jgi:SAM-dependent methyltransferase
VTRTAAGGTAQAGFDPDQFAELFELEPRSWWFRSRNRLIRQTVQRRFPNARSVLEIGCGTGFTLLALRDALPRAALTATELFPEGLEFARRRVPEAHFEQLDARDTRYEGAFDLVGAFDVLEHIDDDGAVLRAMRRALRPGGGLIVTVPQHPSLWSAADEVAHHERRYRRRELVGRVEDAGFRIVEVTSFVMLLLPLMAASRVRRRLGFDFDWRAEYRIPRAVDTAFEVLTAVEQRAISSGVSLPFGGSLLAAATRV